MIEFLEATAPWYALLAIGRPRLERSDSRDGSDPSIRRAMAARPTQSRPGPVRGAAAQLSAVLQAEQFAAAPAGTGSAASVPRMIPYSVVVHAYSNLSMNAHVEQSSFEPGARVAVRAELAQSGIPMTERAEVWADIALPTGGVTTLTMPVTGDGAFGADFAAMRPGVYRVRVRAHGTTPRGETFTRETSLTAAVWRGGDRGPGRDPGTQDLIDRLREHDSRLCDLLSCFLQPEGTISAELERRLRALGIDLDRARKCVAGFCSNEPSPAH